MIISDVAPIIPEIHDVTDKDELLRFCRGVQVALDRKAKTTRRDLDYINDSIPTLATYNEDITKAAKYKWLGEVWYKDADEIVIKPMCINGSPLLSAYFSDGSFLEQTTAITAKLAVPGASGHIGDGITAVLNSALYKLWLWNNAGTLTPMFTYAPLTTFSNANPTNALTLGQINAQDIGKLFPVGAHVVVWQDGNEFETPYFYSVDGNYATATIDVTADKPKVASTTTTVLTLGANLTNATFTAGSTVCQVDCWQPLQIDGTLATGTSGYLDTGIYILTTAAGAIQAFEISGDEFYFVDGTGAADYAYNTGLETFTVGTSYSDFRVTKLPPDKSGIFSTYDGNSQYVYTKPYWVTFGEQMYGAIAAGLDNTVKRELKMLHGIFSAKVNANSHLVIPRGYII